MDKSFGLIHKERYCKKIFIVNPMKEKTKKYTPTKMDLLCRKRSCHIGR